MAVSFKVSLGLITQGQNMLQSRQKEPITLKAAHLKHVEMLQGLGSGFIESFISKSSAFRVLAGTEVLAHMEPGRSVYMLLSGSVRVNMLAASGRQVTYQLLDAGAMFGEMAAIDHLPRSASVSAETDIILAEISGDDFIALCRENADFAVNVMLRLARLSRWLTSRVFEYHTYNVRGRVYMELLRLSEQENDVKFHRISDRDMASRVGTTRENVSRTHAKLLEAKIIERTPNGIAILDVEALQELLADCEFN